MAAAMISGNVEIPSIATALDREVILLLAFQICPRRVNDPTFGKPVFVVRTSRVEYEGLWAIPSVQSYLHLKKTNYISEGIVVFYSGGGRDLGELNFREGETEGGSVVANGV